MRVTPVDFLLCGERTPAIGETIGEKKPETCFPTVSTMDFRGSFRGDSNDEGRALPNHLILARSWIAVAAWCSLILCATLPRGDDAAAPCFGGPCCGEP